MAKKIYDGNVSGKRGRGTGRLRMTFKNNSIKDIGGRSRKNREDPSEVMNGEVDDSGRGERGMWRP